MFLLAATGVPKINAATVAADDASNYSTFGAFTAGNLGTGFGAWTLTVMDGNVSNEGSYLNTSSKAISTSTKSWGFYAHNSQTMQAQRAFTNALSVGQVFQLDMESDGINSGTGHSTPPGSSNANQFGFELKSGSTVRFRFYFIGGASNCALDDNAGTNTSINAGGFPSGGFRVVFKLLSADTYELTLLSPNSGSIIYASGTRTLTGTAGSGIDSVNCYLNNCSADAYFNNMKIGYDAPTISAQPTATPICSGSGASMSVTGASTDGSTLSYAWRRRGNGWIVGGGTGWTIQGGGQAFIQNGGTSIGTSWGLQENTACNPSVQEAYRNLPANMVANQTLSLDYQISTGVNNSGQNSGCSAGTAGISLQDINSGLPAFEFYFQGGQSNFFIRDSSSGTRDSGVPFTTNGLHLDFTLTGSTSYSLQVKRLSDGATFIITGNTISAQTIRRLRFFDFAGGNGNNFYFNNVSVAGTDDNGGNYGTTWSAGDDKGQSPLGASPLGGGTVFSGANTATLSFTNANAADSGKVFDCAVISGQGYTSISSAATLTVNSLPTITTATPMPGGTTSAAYNQTLTSSGGSGSGYTYSLSSGSLPPGLNLSSAGAITGTPTAAGTFNFTVQVSDSNGCGNTKALSITVACATITVSPSALPAATNGQPYSQTFTATGGTNSYTWSVSSGALPSGLSLDTNTGVLSGTPTTTGSSNFTIQATDADGCSGTQAYTLTVAPPISAFKIVAATASPVVGAGDQLTITAVDSDGNTVTGFTGDTALTFSGLLTSGGTPTVTNKNGTPANQGTATTISFTGGVSSAGGLLKTFTTGSQTVHATDGTHSDTSAGGSTVTLTPVAGSAAKLAFTTQPGGGTGGTAWSQQPAVTIQDSFGNTVTTDTSNVTVAIANNPSSGTLSGTKTVAAANGVATFSGLSIDKAGTGYTLSATDGSLTDATSSGFNITVGAAVKVAFTTQPGGGTGGTAWTQQPVVTIQDAGGNTVATDTSTVMLAIANNPGSGTLSGTVAKAAVAGVAAFTGLSIDKAGTGYTLSATDGSLTGATSSSFNITVGAAAKLAFTTQPGNGTGGSALSIQPRVTLQDAGGNTVTGIAQNVTVAIQTNPSGGTLSGTKTVAVNTSTGVATFSGLSIDKAGNGYTLTATGNTVNTTPGVVVSSAFNITVGAATKVVFTTQPGGGTSEATWAQQPVVAIQDAGGNTVTTDSSSVTVNIANNPSGGALSGTTTVAAVGGVATFTDLSIDKTGNGYTLSATDGSLAGATSSSFNITVGTAAQTLVETKPDGTGTVVAAQNLASGVSLTSYAISRDAAGNFISNVAATWSLQNITGNIVTGDLVAATDNKSATLTGNKVGTAKIQAVANTFTGKSGTITVTAPGTANDNACNYTGIDSTWTTVNGGTGFAIWQPTVGSSGGGYFRGSSASNGGTHNIDTACSGNFSWGMFSGGTTNNTDSAHIWRQFSGKLQIGQTFSVDMDNGLINNGGLVGFALQDAGQHDLFKFSFTGGATTYQINNADANPTIGFSRDGLRISFKLTSTTAFTATVASPNTGTAVTYTGTLISQTDQAIAQIVLFTNAAGNGANNDAFFNSMSISNATVTVTPAAGALPAATYGSAYSQTITASAGTAPYTFVVSSGALPGWLSLDANTGQLSGTPDSTAGSSFTITSADAYGYAGSASYALTVNKANQTINGLASTDSRTYGDAPYNLSLTGGGSGNSITYNSSNTGVATVDNGGTVTITGVGSTTITASQAGNANYNPAPDVMQTLTVAQKNLTVTGAIAQNRAYDGTTAATITGATLQGVVGSDDVTVSGGGSFTDKNVGNNKPVTAALVLGGTDAGNYTLTQPTGLTANITAKAVNVTADGGQFKTKGASDPTFTYTADTLFSGDSYSGALSRISGESAGSYAITIGTLTAGSNYTINFTTANFVITGPIAANDTAARLGGSSSFNVPISSLLANDSRIASDGSSHTDGLSITAVTPGSGVSNAQISGSNVSVTVTDPSSNADVTFTYTLSDGTSTDTGTVTVSTIPFTLQIVAVESLTYNSGTNTTTTTVDLLGTPNQNYTLEFSTDLATWSLYSGNPVTTGTGTFSVTVSAPGNHKEFFFRASE